ncbi:hypothetical protein DMUE_1444 [Dictyocoela muelleri]|nr:hypothetical protein DMUE_1444 [Dictyocoela muelleri]
MTTKNFSSSKNGNFIDPHKDEESATLEFNTSCYSGDTPLRNDFETKISSIEKYIDDEEGETTTKDFCRDKNVNDNTNDNMNDNTNDNTDEHYSSDSNNLSDSNDSRWGRFKKRVSRIVNNSLCGPHFIPTCRSSSSKTKKNNLLNCKDRINHHEINGVNYIHRNVKHETKRIAIDKERIGNRNFLRFKNLKKSKIDEKNKRQGDSEMISTSSKKERGSKNSLNKYSNTFPVEKTDEKFISQENPNLKQNEKSENILPEEIKQDKILPEKIKHKEILSEKIKHEEMKYYEIKREEILSEKIKHEEIKQAGNLPEKIKHDEILPEKIKHEEMKYDEIKHDEILPEKIKREEIKHEVNLPEEIKINEILPEEIKHDENLPEEIKLKEILPEEIKRVEILPVEESFMKITPIKTEIAISEIIPDLKQQEIRSEFKPQQIIPDIRQQKITFTEVKPLKTIPNVIKPIENAFEIIQLQKIDPTIKEIVSDAIINEDLDASTSKDLFENSVTNIIEEACKFNSVEMITGTVSKTDIQQKDDQKLFETKDYEKQELILNEIPATEIKTPIENPLNDQKLGIESVKSLETSNSNQSDEIQIDIKDEISSNHEKNSKGLKESSCVISNEEQAVRNLISVELPVELPGVLPDELPGALPDELSAEIHTEILVPSSVDIPFEEEIISHVNQIEYKSDDKVKFDSQEYENIEVNPEEDENKPGYRDEEVITEYKSDNDLITNEIDVKNYPEACQNKNVSIDYEETGSLGEILINVEHMKVDPIIIESLKTETKEITQPVIILKREAMQADSNSSFKPDENVEILKIDDIPKFDDNSKIDDISKNNDYNELISVKELVLH